VGLALAFVGLAPLTSIDAAQQVGLPLLTDKLWFHIATTWRFRRDGVRLGHHRRPHRLCELRQRGLLRLGAFTAGVIVTNLKLPFRPRVAAGARVAAVFALIVGLPLLRPSRPLLRGRDPGGRGRHRRGRSNNIEPLGGATGLFLPIIRSTCCFYLMPRGDPCGADHLGHPSHAFGYGLLAISQNEEAAAVIGVNNLL